VAASGARARNAKSARQATQNGLDRARNVRVTSAQFSFVHELLLAVADAKIRNFHD
jgi:hypothetical protein